VPSSAVECRGRKTRRRRAPRKRAPCAVFGLPAAGSWVPAIPAILVPSLPGGDNMVEKPCGGSENEPVVVASNGQSFNPFSDLFTWMVEPSKRPPPRATVETRLQLAGYPQAPKPAA
jgi:hypothetical protein